MSLFDNASLVLTPNGYKGGSPNGKLYSIKPTSGLGDMVVTRNTTSTRVNSEGLIQSVAFNAPRIDYPPLGGCPRILVEPLRTNVVLYSEQFDNVYWDKSLVTITPNAAVAPDNNTTADKFIPNTTNSVHQIARTALASNAYTFSVFAKAGGETTFSMWLRGASVRAEFNLSNATITVNTATSAKIEPYPNGWYRCSVYDATPGTTVQIYGRSGGAFAGNGVDGIFFWGAQVEAGTKATSYIPTTTIALARNADVISQTGVSSLIGQPNGTIFVEANLTANTAERRIITVSNGTESQRIMFWTQGTTLYVDFNNSSVSLGAFPIGTVKIAVGYTIGVSSTTYSIKVNNNTLTTGTAASAPSSLSAIHLGCNVNGALNLNDRIESATLFLTRLTDPQLATLTAI